MKTTKLKPILIANLVFVSGALLLSASPAWSQSSSLDAHVHGEAELMIAIEGTDIEMHLVSPAANIYGFEHEPANNEQREQIHLAEEILAAADSLFEFEGADCQASEQTLELPYLSELAGTHDTHHNEHEHEENHSDEHHSDHHDNDHHDEQDADEEHAEHESHTEISAAYSFECGADSVTGIRVVFLENFPAIESLDVQWITEEKQGAQELNASQPMIELK